MAWRSLHPFLTAFLAFVSAFDGMVRRNGARALIFAASLVVSLIAVGPLANAESTATSSEWVARSWQTEDGLPQNTVNALLQTRDGFLWVGTSGGLARFDGVRFLKFGLQDGLRSVRISTLVEDKQGALWIGTTGGGLSRRENGRFTSFGAAEGFPSGADVVSMTAGHDGSLWIGTTQGLVRWSNGAFSLIGEEQGLPRDQVRALVEDSEGTLWVSLIEKGIFRGRNGQFARMEETGPNPTYSLMEDRDGTIWAGSGNGLLWCWRDGAWKRFDATAGLPLASFVALAQGGDGTLWICAGSRGLYRASGERFVPALSEGNLSDQAVVTAMVDREGSVWVGTASGGLGRLSHRVLQYWSAGAGSGPDRFNSIAEDASGVWWIGAGSKGIYRFEGGRFSILEDPAVSAKTHHIYSTTSTSDGSIWAAGEQCLYRFQPGQPTQAFLDPPIRGEAIRALCAEGGTLWLGTYYSTLLKWDAAAGVQVVAPRGSFHGDITSIVSESAGTLWIGSAGGLYRWEHGRIVRTWDTRDGLLTARVRALFRDFDGTLWIGTHGGGLARLKDGRIFNITTRHGLIDDVISQIVADDFGYLNLGCNRGIMRLDRRELHALADGKISELHPVAFGKNEGMLKEQCAGGHSPTAIKTRDGRLLFPTAGGIAEISPRRLERVMTIAPQARIDSVAVDGRLSSFDTGFMIPPGKHRIEVSFSAPALRNGEWVRFRHRLEGVDRDWVKTSGNAPAVYDGLSPGDYSFRVEAADGQGKWNEPGGKLAFTVQPFFWQTLWFRAFGVLLLVGASSAAAWWLLHRKHLRHLADLTRERQQQAELAHAGRVALLGELSASLAHELKQPLASILSNAQAGLRFLNDESTDPNEVRDILKDITSEDRRASEIIDRLRTMVKKGETQMEARDLNADIEQVLLLLRSELATRHVSVDTELAPELPPIRGDHIQLQQVLLNLVINGSDAMHANAPDERHLVIETARDSDGLIRVSVTDCGAGIAPEMLERIFEPFYSTKDSGLGMGLAICQAIIKAHGGRLWAANNPDRGATFHFTLMLGERPPS
jgi:signal transduction histidine kinase/ligand-binding sensor domain-containing protein